MHFSLLAAFVLGATNDASHRWGESFADEFKLCEQEKFIPVVCPQIVSDRTEVKYLEEPSGTLTHQNLLLAHLMYQRGKSPQAFLAAELAKNKSIPDTVKNRARWLLAQTLFDEKRYAEAEKIYDDLIPTYRGRALFHQQRAWVKYFLGKYDEALGSILSAESPLIFKMAFAKKWFLQALIQRDVCDYAGALKTIEEGRAFLEQQKTKPLTTPWLDWCRRENKGLLCEQISQWQKDAWNIQVSSALTDLNYLELEIAERRNASAKTAVSKPAIRWPFNKEIWADELGRYRVEVTNQCS